MKIKSLTLFLAFMLGSVLSAWSQQDVLLSTQNTSLLLLAKKGEPLKIAYYGDRLKAEEASEVWRAGIAFDRHAYPTFNSWCPEECAIMVQHANGDIALDLNVQDVKRESTTDGEKLVVTTRDKVYPFEVKVCYLTHTHSDVIETWTEITHQEKKNDVMLKQYASAYLPIRGGNVWLSHFHGAWGNEFGMYEEPLTAGMKVIKNRDGVRNGLEDHGEIMISLDGQPHENQGRVIGAAICWSGNYKLRLDTDLNGKHIHHFFAGIDESGMEYYLKAGETFVTPELAFTYSHRGKGGISRNFHNWARHSKLHNGLAPRDVLLNSWEGVYLDVNHEKLNKMMKGIAELGGEMFVMDDGWFASKKYNRKVDNAALGDWEVDGQKLPQGIPALIDEAKKNKLHFGIWIEPEMGNWGKSEMYDKHPDWFTQNPGRDPKLGRGGTQNVLDLSNPAVQDFVFGIVDKLMTAYPEIAYMKWDANSSLMNYGSPYLPKDRQSHLYVDYHKGLHKVLERIRAKYPNLVLQACASGGGRATYGVMPYFDEFWTSDDTDALQRVFIQWGTSHFYPAAAMAAHVSASPNHQTGRVIPLKFRFDVAMMGRLGMEMKPSDLTADEKAFAKQAISDYKRLREVIQQGDLYRLISPYEGSGMAASLMYVSPDKHKAVFYAYKMKHFVNQQVPRFSMDGLDPDKKYRLHEINRTDDGMKHLEGAVISGNVLMNGGVEIPLTREYASRVIELTATE